MFDSVKVFNTLFSNEMLKAYDEYKKVKEAAAKSSRTEAEEIEFQKALEVVNRYVNK